MRLSSDLSDPPTILIALSIDININSPNSPCLLHLPTASLYSCAPDTPSCCPPDAANLDRTLDDDTILAGLHNTTIP
jgi:hypothetical protein